MSGPRVLTFNFHEPYICMMARIGLPITVGLYDEPSMARPWHSNHRPIPKGVTLAPETEWRAGLKSGAFDVLVAHNELNALHERKSGIPSILLCHNRRSFLHTTYEGDYEEGLQKYIKLLGILSQTYTFVFISESKRADYGYPGPVIPPGIDVDEFGGYTGDEAGVLRVGNGMRGRDLMFDVGFQEQVCRSLPNRVVGLNPDIPGSQPAESFDALRRDYRTLRCLLHVSREAYEDGYNLAMLEAMATGMPVVSLANPTSPLTDGVDGYTSYDADVLHGRLRMLLNDQALARKIGARGRETVARTFPMDAFVQRWRTVLEDVAAEGAARAGGMGHRPAPMPEVPRLEIVVDYAPESAPGPLVEKVLRSGHDVITASDFAQRPAGASGDGASPGAYLLVDAGDRQQPPDLTAFDGLKMCYLTRTGQEDGAREELARGFAFTYAARRGEFEALARAGVPNVAWMPPGCIASEPSPETERPVDVVLAHRPGTPCPALGDALKERFPNVEVCPVAWPDLSALFQRAKMVVVPPDESDLSEYLFEALASGAMVVAHDSPVLRAAVEPGRHLAAYQEEDEAIRSVRSYLDNPAASRLVANAGREAAFSSHTMERRTAEMLAMALEAVGSHSGYVGEGRFQSGGYYRCPRPELAVQIPRTARRVLDCGCGGGEFGRSLKERGVEEVVGIEVVERAWEMAKTVLDDAILGSIEDLDLPFEDGYFDCIVFGDVLEHLVDPCAALRKVSRVLAPDGAIVMSIPNVRFWDVVRMLSEGRWHYDDAGILDRTHLRFFTAVEMRELVTDAGLEVLRLEPLSMWAAGNLPRNDDGSLSFGRVTITDVSDAEYQDFLTYQYLVVAGNPNVDRLAAARRALDAQDNELAYELAVDAVGPNEWDRKCLMARALGRVGKLDRCADLYREALDECDDAQIAGELGIVLLAMNKQDEARPLLERALEAGNANDRVLGTLGIVRMSEGDNERAFDLFLKAFSIDFDQPALVTALVEAGLTLGRMEEALPYVVRFVDYYPGNLDAVCMLAEVLAGLGRTDEALERLETVLLLLPDHEGARRIKAHIEKGNADPGGTA